MSVVHKAGFFEHTCLECDHSWTNDVDEDENCQKCKRIRTEKKFPDLKICGHFPLESIVTFEGGDNKTTSYNLCKECKGLSCYQKYIVKTEPVPEGINNQ